MSSTHKKVNKVTSGIILSQIVKHVLAKHSQNIFEEPWKMKPLVVMLRELNLNLDLDHGECHYQTHLVSE